jgi:RNase P/RNase MRP subunit POP5
MTMPRAKKPKPQPNEVFTIEVDGEDVICEVWENSADEGTRGAHMRQKRDQIYDAVLKYCEDALAGNSNITKQKVQRLINGQESLTVFGKIILTIAKQEKIPIEKTLSQEIAKSVRNHYKAIDAALAQMALAIEKKQP